MSVRRHPALKGRAKVSRRSAAVRVGASEFVGMCVEKPFPRVETASAAVEMTSAPVEMTSAALEMTSARVEMAPARVEIISARVEMSPAAAALVPAQPEQEFSCYRTSGLSSS